MARLHVSDTDWFPSQGILSVMAIFRQQLGRDKKSPAPRAVFSPRVESDSRGRFQSASLHGSSGVSLDPELFSTLLDRDRISVEPRERKATEGFVVRVTLVP